MRLNVFLRQNGQQPEQLVKRISANLNHTETKHVNPTEKAKVPISYFAKFLKAKVDKKWEFNELQKLTERMDLDQDGNIDENDIVCCLGRIEQEDFTSPPPKKS